MEGWSSPEVEKVRSARFLLARNRSNLLLVGTPTVGTRNLVGPRDTGPASLSHTVQAVQYAVHPVF